MWWELLVPLHLETYFVHTIPWNDVPLLFKCSPKILIMSVRRSDKQTLAVIVYTVSIWKKIDKEGHSGMLIPFGVKAIKALQALHDTSPLCLFLLFYMFWHKKYYCNHQIWSNPPIISQDIEHKNNSNINQGS